MRTWTGICHFKAAIMKAVIAVFKKGILEELLRKNQAEVLHMLLTEYDEKAHMRGSIKRERKRVSKRKLEVTAKEKRRLRKRRTGRISERGVRSVGQAGPTKAGARKKHPCDCRRAGDRAAVIEEDW